MIPHFLHSNTENPNNDYQYPPINFVQTLQKQNRFLILGVLFFMIFPKYVYQDANLNLFSIIILFSFF